MFAPCSQIVILVVEHSGCLQNAPAHWGRRWLVAAAGLWQEGRTPMTSRGAPLLPPALHRTPQRLGSLHWPSRQIASGLRPTLHPAWRTDSAACQCFKTSTPGEATAGAAACTAAAAAATEPGCKPCLASSCSAGGLSLPPSECAACITAASPCACERQYPKEWCLTVVKTLPYAQQPNECTFVLRRAATVRPSSCGVPAPASSSGVDTYNHWQDTLLAH